MGPDLENDLSCLTIGTAEQSPTPPDQCTLQPALFLINVALGILAHPHYVEEAHLSRYCVRIKRDPPISACSPDCSDRLAVDE